jgi:hypothetical protein
VTSGRVPFDVTFDGSASAAGNPLIPLDRWGYTFGDSGRPIVPGLIGDVNPARIERLLEGLDRITPFGSFSFLQSKYPGLQGPPNFDIGTWPVIRNSDGTATGPRVTSYLDLGGTWWVIPKVTANAVLMTQTEAEGYFTAKGLHMGFFGPSPNPAVVTAMVNDIHTAQDNRYAWAVKGTGAPPNNTVHTYTAPGTYRAVLTVIDAVGRPAWVESAPITATARCLPRSSGEPLDAVVLNASKAIPLALTQRIATIHIDDCIAPFDGAGGIPAGGGVVFGTIPGVTLNGVDRIPFCQDGAGSVGVGIQLTNAKSLRQPRADSA